MDYKVVMTTDAEEDLDRFIRYLLFEKQNRQAASNVLNDFEATKQTLSNVAGSLKLCDNPRLNALRYRKIHFLSHRYFMLYRVKAQKKKPLIFNGFRLQYSFTHHASASLYRSASSIYSRLLWSGNLARFG